jgi:hypothetical protein
MFLNKDEIIEGCSTQKYYSGNLKNPPDGRTEYQKHPGKPLDNQDTMPK